MCGIAGVAARIPAPDVFAGQALHALRHRGPDDEGCWRSADRRVVLAHTRLAVIDVSVAGHQPMASGSGRYVVTYNGEIYNHVALRRELANETWRGTSDTETMLTCMDRYGVDAAIARLAGMFALAVWDNETGTLHLARDRLGEKPLYYLVHDGALWFASELRALRHVPGFEPAIDPVSLAALLRYGYVPSPRSIYRHVAKLDAGSMLRFDPESGALDVRRYWQATAAASAGLDHRPGDASGFAERLARTVSEQMISDVPLGAFLSGGIDSSAIVTMMQRASARPVRTFTMGFAESSLDERRHAREVSARLGTDHTEYTVTSEDALEVVPLLATLYSEPFADSSQIPTFLVSRLARQSVTVALSGDGGDELFGGYNRYRAAPALFEASRAVPGPVRRGLARAMRALPVSLAGAVEQAMARAQPFAGTAYSNLADKLAKAADVFEQDDLDGVYRRLVSTWPDAARVVRGLGPVPDDDITARFGPLDSRLTGVERMMLRDLLTYLPDDVMCKVDRASMGVGLETRAPFLDHRLVEYAWQLPVHEKIRDGRGKWPLRKLLYDVLPRDLVDRPKMGFAVPLADWLRGPLAAWADAQLDEDRLRSEGHFDVDAIRLKWRQHRSGSMNWHHHLWSVLMFQAWLERA